MAVPPPPGRRRGRGRQASPLRGRAVLYTTPRLFAPLYTPDLSTVVVLKESLPSHPTARWSLHQAPTEPPQRAGKAGMCKLRQSKLACMGKEKQPNLCFIISTKTQEAQLVNMSCAIIIICISQI